MAIEKRTVVTQIEIVEAGRIQVRMEKQVLEDGRVISRGYHRTAIDPGSNAADQLADVNMHLKEMGCEPLAMHEIERLKRYVELEHTPAVVQAFSSLRKAHQSVQAALAKHAEQFAKVSPSNPASAAALGAAAAEVTKTQADAETAYIATVEAVRRART